MFCQKLLSGFFKYRTVKRYVGALKLLVLGAYLMILPSIKLVSFNMKRNCLISLLYWGSENCFRGELTLKQGKFAPLKFFSRLKTKML